MTARALSALCGSSIGMAASGLVRCRVAGHAATVQWHPEWRPLLANTVAADLARELGHADRVLLGAAVASLLPADTMRGALARSRAMGKARSCDCGANGDADLYHPRSCPMGAYCRFHATGGHPRDRHGRDPMVAVYAPPTDADRAEAHAALEQTRVRLGW